jgi:hypothetical protein
MERVQSDGRDALPLTMDLVALLLPDPVPRSPLVAL